MVKNQTQAGVVYALSAYGLWGLLPLYLRELNGVSPDEILVHRIIWSLAFTLLLITITRKFETLKAALVNRRTMMVLAVSSVLIASNWLIYIWAVDNNKLIEASLGYYINPIINILLAMVFLQERLRRLQKAAMFVAAIGVAVELIAYGSIPWVAFGVAFTFGGYALIRKKLVLDSQIGLTLETACLTLPALLYLYFGVNSNTSNMLNNSWDLNLLLMLAGPITSVPLVFFAAAASRLTMTTLGFFQYITPSTVFILAITLFGETLTPSKVVTFAFIWLALAVFTYDAVLWQKKLKITR